MTNLYLYKKVGIENKKDEEDGSTKYLQNWGH